MTATEFRLAAYGVCLDGDRVLLARYVPVRGSPYWTLPGGRVEHGEDPFEAVVREIVEETGCCIGVVERLLGVDSRVIRSVDRLGGGPDLHNVGVFYQVRIVGGQLRPEPNGETYEPAWIQTGLASQTERAAVVDVGLTLAQGRPATGHVQPVEVGWLDTALTPTPSDRSVRLGENWAAHPTNAAPATRGGDWYTAVTGK